MVSPKLKPPFPFPMASPSEASLIAYNQLITKHVLDDPARLMALKKRFAMCELANEKTTAAALGYLVAKDEAEHGPTLPMVYEQVLEQVEDIDTNPCVRTDCIFTIIYDWLHDELLQELNEDYSEKLQAFIKGLFIDKTYE